jgi:hypothetical protein
MTPTLFFLVVGAVIVVGVVLIVVGKIRERRYAGDLTTPRDPRTRTGTEVIPRPGEDLGSIWFSRL